MNKLLLFGIGAILSFPIMLLVFALGMALTHMGMWVVSKLPTQEPPAYTQPAPPPKNPDCLACRFAYPDRR